MSPQRLVVALVVAALAVVAAPPAAAQFACGVELVHPAGATCSGGANHGRPCYVFDAGDNFGCPGGSCVASPGGGRATYYEAATGACGIPVAGAGALVTAVAEHLWDGSAVCGRCARVTGPLGSVVVEVTDQCPAAPNPEWCAGDAAHLDLSTAAFAAVADPDRGVAYVAWEVVPCPLGAATVQVLNKDGVNPWWYAAFVLDTRHGVSTVEVKDAAVGSSWQSGVRQDYNAFVFTSGAGFELPLTVRLTDLAGDIVTAPGLVTTLADFAQFDTLQQFAECALFADGFESGTVAAWGP